MKKMISKIAVVAILATATILSGQFFFGTPILGREAWSIDTDFGQVPDQRSAEFSVYAAKLFEQAKASPRVVEAGSLPAEQGDTTQVMSGSTGFSIEPDILPGTLDSGLARTGKRFAWWPATLLGAAYAVFWIAIGAGLTFWIIHVANSHRHHHRHAI